MRLAIIADEQTGSSLQEKTGELQVTRMKNLDSDQHFDACIDLLYLSSTERNHRLQQLAPIIIVNAVNLSQDQLPPGFTRINGWPGFLDRDLIEASTGDDELRNTVSGIFHAFGKKISWSPGFTGFIAPRVIAMIINEAYLALEENVSTREEIDTAMKLGTNYPYGPFEWSRLIGLSNILTLLNRLSEQNKRYNPAPLLKTEASGS
jgi:3-hydroxybutyryl-CoA dehydrogenase